MEENTPLVLLKHHNFFLVVGNKLVVLISGAWGNCPQKTTDLRSVRLPTRVKETHQTPIGEGDYR